MVVSGVLVPMYDFERWKAWVKAKVADMQTKEVAASLHIGRADGPKLGLEFGRVGNHAMASFANWITGETDYTVLTLPSAEAKMVSNRWMIVLTDATFETHFEEFVTEFRKHNAALDDKTAFQPHKETL
jgi:hypothetical protein